nr:flavodoxin family protein [uncultured Desulfuromonas sp.]
MKKNILILSSSPRKGGNSDRLCDEFMRGAIETGHTVEKIRLAEQDIRYCTGCCTCINKQGACVQQDDVNAIVQKMIACDVLVLATPVYFHAMNAQMKTFIDRCCSAYTLIEGKEVYFFASAAGGTSEARKAADSLRVFTDCLKNITEKGLLSATGMWNVGGVEGNPVLKQAYTLGKNA